MARLSCVSVSFWFMWSPSSLSVFMSVVCGSWVVAFWAIAQPVVPSRIISRGGMAAETPFARLWVSR